MKILVISLEVWRDDNNGGNVLSNIFRDFEGEFAQIFCSSGVPNNNICSRYFQMTDSMAIKNVLKKEKMGRVLQTVENIEEENDRKLDDLKRRGSFEILRIARECTWAIADFVNAELDQFVLEFEPDIIFAPCYSSHYMLKLTRHVADLVKKPVISYVSDDVYSLKHIRISPLFWINRFLLRRNMRRTWPYYSLIYTMTEIQKMEMEKVFSKPMKILRKHGDFEECESNRMYEYPIKMIYAGGIYLNRWKTLAKLVKEMKKVNQNEVKMKLDIYTGNQLNKRAFSILNDGRTSEVHPSISQRELKEKYRKSDIALHVEGFDLKNRLNVRLSFSTKIVDCLESGCAVMAICDSKQGGFAYLKDENAAICIEHPKKIASTLKMICDDLNVIDKYRKKAFECGKKNHMRYVIQSNMQKDFYDIGKMAKNN